MMRQFVSVAFATAAFVVASLPAQGETPRVSLLEIQDAFGHSLESKRALRPLIEKATPLQLGDLDRGLYFEDLGETALARRAFDNAAAQLNEATPGPDAWCIAYKLLRIPDVQVDHNEPSVREMLALRQQLNIPLTDGDLEKRATTTRLLNRWQALPKDAQAENGPLPKKLKPIDRAVALAVRGYHQDDTVAQTAHASARCYLRSANLKPFYGEGAKLGLPDFTYSLANDLAKTSFTPFWETAGQLYAHVAAQAEPPLSVFAGTALARLSERLMASDSKFPPPLTWPEILEHYRQGMAAGYEIAWVLYANAVHQGLGGLAADEAEAVRLYKAMLDRQDAKFYGFMSIVGYIYAQEELTALWQAGKLPMSEAEQGRYLTLKARLPAADKP